MTGFESVIFFVQSVPVKRPWIRSSSPTQNHTQPHRGYITQQNLEAYHTLALVENNFIFTRPIESEPFHNNYI